MTDIPAICDNRFVGVLITDGEGRYLISDRATGVGLVCGHVGQHQAYRDAARAVAGGHTGLEVLTVHLLAASWSPDPCRQGPGQADIGQQWQIWGVLACRYPPPREASNVRWVSGRDLRHLAARTVLYHSGDISDAEFAADPGIAPEWVGVLERLLVITVPPGNLEPARAAAPAPGQRPLPQRLPAEHADLHRHDPCRPSIPSFGPPTDGA